MYCFDTSVIVEYLRGNKDIIEKINKIIYENIEILDLKFGN